MQYTKKSHRKVVCNTPHDQMSCVSTFVHVSYLSQQRLPYERDAESLQRSNILRTPANSGPQVRCVPREIVQKRILRLFRKYGRDTKIWQHISALDKPEAGYAFSTTSWKHCSCMIAVHIQLAAALLLRCDILESFTTDTWAENDGKKTLHDIKISKQSKPSMYQLPNHVKRMFSRKSSQPVWSDVRCSYRSVSGNTAPCRLE